MTRPTRWLAPIAGFGAAGLAAAAAPVAAAPASLEQTLTTIAAVPAGRVGIAAIDLATGRRVAVHGDEPFPLASTVKLAVATMLLAEVDAGRRSLATMVKFDEAKRTASEGIGDSLPFPGIILSNANYLELMMTVSDNSATDTLIAELGGTAAVERWLVAHKVIGLRIDRTIARLVVDNVGLPVGADGDPVQALHAADAMPPLTTAQIAAAAQKFDADPRDHGSAVALADLLARIDRGELLAPASRKLLFDIMTRCKTGPDRIKGGLPPGTVVAHKTGTLTGVSDDVGIVILPDGRRFAIAVLSRGIADGKARAAIIAGAARAVYDDELARK